MSTAIVLLRGINVGGHKRVPMADLRDVAKRVGCTLAETYIQSGNIVVSSGLTSSALEKAFEHELEKTFGFEVDVIVRTAKQWANYAKRSPYEDAETERPNMLYLCLAKSHLKAGAEKMITSYAGSGERVTALKDALWIDYPDGSGRTKITPSVLDRAAGSPVTARNWRTVQKLAEMSRG